MTRSSGEQRGFTLIEVLVALALMAMIATILIASLEIGGHTWQRVMRTTANTDDIAQTQEFLRQRLISLYPYEQRANDVSRPEFLVSDGESLEFTAPAPDVLMDGMWRYRVSLSGSSGALRVGSRRDGGGGPADGADWVEETLLPHVTSLAIQFLQPSKEMPGQWVDRWTDPTRVPALIRIDIGFAANDKRRWPTLYVQPHVDTPVTCEFDVVSRQCRSGA